MILSSHLNYLLVWQLLLQVQQQQWCTHELIRSAVSVVNSPSASRVSFFKCDQQSEEGGVLKLFPL